MAHCAAANNVNGAYYVSTGADADAVSAIAAAGYEQIEIFDGNLLAYEGREAVFRDILAKNKVSLLAVYCAANFIYDEILDEELFRIEKAAAFARKFGATEIALGGGATRFNGIQEGDYPKLAAALDKAAAILPHGMRASYHPHMGSLVQTPEQLDRIMPLAKICLCPDTGHIAAGGGDPVAIVKKYADRIKYIHLKDITKEGMFCPLGQGVIDFPAIIEALRGRDILYAIECDAYSGRPEDAAKITADYLKTRLRFA
jgi:inosose dehydratase